MSADPVNPSPDLCPTGVPGLDSILRGGIPRNRVYLIMGDPGAGKTTVSLQFLIEGAKRGERALYISLSETREELAAIAASHGWSLEAVSVLDLPALNEKLGSVAQSTVFHPSEVELGRTTKVLFEAVETIKPRRVVFDSLSEMRLLAHDALRYRRQMLALKQFFIGRDSTVFLLDDRDSRLADLQVDSIAHGVIGLEKASPDYGTPRRRLEVVKLRGVDFQGGRHDFTIRRGGVHVYPRLIAADHHSSFEDATVGSDIAELDDLLRGGLDRGTSTLLMGPAGSGKSTLATQFIVAAARRGERGIIYTFDETLRTLRKRSTALGLDLEAAPIRDNVELRHVDPAEISPGELAEEIRSLTLENDLRFVVLDSLNGYMKAMPDEEFLTLHLHELLTFLNQQGIITLMLLAQHGVLGHMQSPADITYLADTVILIRFFELQGSVKRAISVLKKRSGDHEKTIRAFEINPGGIHVGEPLCGFHGVLSGTPVYTGSDARTDQKEDT